MTKARTKRIEAHSLEELDSAIDTAVRLCERQGLDFYRILHGIDAYMERRKRRVAQRVERVRALMHAEEWQEANWGDSWDGQDDSPGVIRK